jgi:polysaccharide biosynthesis/export protein
MSTARSYGFAGIMAAGALLGGCASLPGQQAVISPRAARIVQLDAGYAPPPAVVATVPDNLAAYRPLAYRVGPGDIINVMIWDHPELGSVDNASRRSGVQVQVRADGKFFFPYIGLVSGAGMSVDELRLELTRRLASVYVEPQVDLSVTGFNSQQITVRGAFIHTRPQAITSTPLSLAAALGSASIDTARANLGQFTLTRNGKAYRLDLNTSALGDGATSKILLKGGDHLHLPITDQRDVIVLGEVLRPIVVTMRGDSLTLAQALGRAGGLDQATARARSVYVIRTPADEPVSQAIAYRLDARSPASYAVASRFRLLAGDVVFIGASGITRFTRLIRQLLPWATTLRTAALAGDALLDASPGGTAPSS